MGGEAPSRGCRVDPLPLLYRYSFMTPQECNFALLIQFGIGD